MQRKKIGGSLKSKDYPDNGIIYPQRKWILLNYKKVTTESLWEDCLQQDFQRAAIVSVENNEEAVPEPSVAKISSFLSYYRQKLRGGVCVGQTSLQDIQRFEELNQYGEFI